ncbi:MAG TPA: poly-gamma-glutamate synthase PgsB [Bacillota bacterium]|nr:poly-gamma-glutamate synthase PgsB [Bacillota bacterium]
MGGYVVLLATALLLGAGMVEHAIHRRRISSFRVRVNVNGTRGKSTVTRLIAAGLREGGIRTVAKTTGTFPRLILPDGSEEPIKRRGRARISEHIWVARRAKALHAEALVVECMALEAENQRVYEHMLVRSTIGVITNVRPDHLDVMGPGLEDVARTLAITIPKGGDLVTGQGPFDDMLKEKCLEAGSRFHAVDEGTVSPEELSMFAYTSFRENVAEALKACELAGVDRKTALAGMWKAAPDPGVRPVCEFVYMGRRLRIVNAFAANDVESTKNMWDAFAKPGTGSYDARYIVVNNREDRPQRVGEMSALAAGLPVEGVFYIGKLQKLASRLTPKGAPNVRTIGSQSPEDVLREIASNIPEGASALLFLAGNTKGIGSLLTDYIAELCRTGGGRLA